MSSITYIAAENEEENDNYVLSLFSKAIKDIGISSDGENNDTLDWLKESFNGVKSVKYGITTFRSRYGDSIVGAKIVSYVIILDMEENGTFLVDSQINPYYFNNSDDTAYSISIVVKEDQGFLPLLAQKYGVNITTYDGKFILEEIRTHTLNYGIQCNIRRMFHFDRHENQLYVFDRCSQYFILDGRTINLVSNGTDGVYFHYPRNRNGKDLIEFCPSINTQKDSHIYRILIDGVPYSDEGSLTPDEQKILHEIYLYSIPFGDILKTKPILTYFGAKGSGKSYTMRSIGVFILGSTYDLTHPPEESSFPVIAANSILLYMDNVDKPHKWFQNAISTASTGIVHEKRKLYTDDCVVILVPKCFIGLSLRDIRFYQEDVIDRMIVFRVKRLEDFIPEVSLSDSIESSKLELWSEFLANLNKIVKAIAENPSEQSTTPHRMADWAVLSKSIGKALGYQDGQLEDILVKLDRDKAFLVLEDDPLFGSLNWWITSKHNDEGFVQASILHTGMKGRAGFDNRYRSAVSLGKRLRNIQSELKLYFGMECKMNPSMKIWEYKFPMGLMKRNDMKVDIAR